MQALLLDAIWADPDDDGPRLVYADWLMERGHPHGELIALQCRRARDGAPPVPRERELEDQLAGSLLGRIGGFVDRVRFERGFPHAARVIGSMNGLALMDPGWNSFGELDFSSSHGFGFVETTVHVIRFLCTRSLRAVIGLGEPSLYFLCRGGAVPNLRRLEVSVTGEDALGAIAASSALIGLRSLRITATRSIAPASIERFRATDCGRRLLELNVHQ